MNTKLWQLIVNEQRVHRLLAIPDLTGLTMRYLSSVMQERTNAINVYVEHSINNDYDWRDDHNVYSRL